MRRKKIILIRNAQPYDFGGAERYPVFVSKILKKNNKEPILISSSPSLLKYAKDAGVETLHGPWWSNQQWSGVRALLFPIYVFWQIILFFWYLVVFIRLRPQAVHIQSKDDFIAATFAARVVGMTVVWTDHADLKHIWLNLGVWYKNPVGKLVYFAAHFAHAITSISKSEYREVTRHLAQKSRVRSLMQVVHNGSPDVRNEYHKTAPAKFTFCSTNRLVGDKGILEMITAFRRFHKKYPDSQLILVGNGPEEEHFKELASGDPGIVFTGLQADPLTFVASASVLLQPTYHEGFSISILEAFMLQKAVIATSVGGNLEMIVDDENGLLVPAKDADSLYAAMITLHDNPAQRERLAKNGRNFYAKEFIFDNIVKERFIPLYDKTTH